MWSGTVVKLRERIYERGKGKIKQTRDESGLVCVFFWPGDFTLCVCLCFWPLRSLFFASLVPGFFVAVFALGNDERLACSEVALYMFSDTRTLQSGLGFLCSLCSRSFSSQKLF